MDKHEVYRKIKKIADELTQDESVFDRADLAYELKEYGVKSDSLEISALVWGAYDFFNQNANIKKAFMNNARDVYLVDEYKIYYLLEGNDDKALFQHIDNQLERGNSSLDLFKALTATDDSSVLTIPLPMKLISFVMRTKGVQDVRQESEFIIDGYTKMVDTYETARSGVKAVTSDFVMLRGKVLETYREYAFALIDVFGDSVKMISPKLFDYNSIEWLDVKGMIKDIHLEYEQITNSCSLLISEISKSFNKSAEKSILALRNRNMYTLSLAGLSAMSHYFNSQEKTLRLKADLLKLKNNVKKDANAVYADMSRLLVIFKTLNDLYIPKANAFYKYADKVLDKELKELLNSVYSTAELKKMKLKRDEVIKECKLLEQHIIDYQFNIDYYTSHISECNVLIENHKPSYDLAVESRPQPPFVLFNILSFNKLKKKYNRNFYEWNQQYSDLLDAYVDFQLDIKLDRDALLETELHLHEKKKKHKMLVQELEIISNDILQVIRVDDTLKLKIAKHLSSLIQLLKVSKEIVESKLDDELTKALYFESKSIELPLEMQKSISMFTNSLNDSLVVASDFIVNKLIDNDDNEVSLNDVENLGRFDVKKIEALETERDILVEEISSGKLNTEELQEKSNRLTELIDQINLINEKKKAIESVSNLIGAGVTLEEMKKNSKLIAEEYDLELKKLQRKFKNNLEGINNETEVLKEALKKINTATNHEDLKDGLLSLIGDESTVFSEKDITKFLDGIKTLEI